MDLRQVARALQSGNAPLRERALKTLYNYNDPLTDKEAATLAEYNRTVMEQLEGGVKVDEAPPEVAELDLHPAKAFHPLAVIQCVAAMAKVPHLPHSLQRTLQRQLLPHLAARTPLSAEEWCAALHMAGAALPVRQSRTALQCLEVLVELAGPALLFPARPPRTMRYRKRVLRKESQSVKLKEVSEEEGQLAVLRAVARVVQAYAELHASRQKHSARALGDATANELFLTSGPLRRLRAAVAVEAEAGREEEEAMAALAAIGKKLPPLDAIAVSVVWPHVWSVSKDQLSAAAKSSPGSVERLTGGARSPVGGLALEKAEEVVQYCLYHMGLTTTTSVEGFGDLLSILVAAGPADAVGVYLAERGKDALAQLLSPFATNAKVLTGAAADRFAPAYAELARRAHAGLLSRPTAGTDAVAALVKGLVQACAVVVGTRCRSAQEKASVMGIVAAMVAALPAEVREAVDTTELVPVLRREVAVPAPESVQQALQLMRLLRMEGAVTAGLVDAVRAAKRDEAMRRVLLVGLDPEHTPRALLDELVSGVLEECVEVEVVRPDAFLALAFIAKADPERAHRLAPLLSTADVLGQLGSASDAAVGGDSSTTTTWMRTAELTRAAEVATTLADVGIYGPLAMLLTHPSGLPRTILTSYIRQRVAPDMAKAQAAWAGLAETVFGLAAEAKPRVLSDSAADALKSVGTALLAHASTGLPCATYLPQILLCCGHDHVQGEDPYFYLPDTSAPRRHRARELQRVRLEALDSLLTGELIPALSEHAAAVAQALLASVGVVGKPHLATAACRALTLLLTRTRSAAAEDVFARVVEKLKGSVAYFHAQDGKDRAIAAENDEVMATFERETMRELQLLKTYPDRPPKGTSEDDFLDMKKRDAKALAKGLETLRQEVDRRTRAILPEVHAHKAVFLAVRLMGTNGRFPDVGVSVLYPYLQSVLNECGSGGPPALSVITLDAVVGLFSRTPLRPVAERMAMLVARLHAEPTLTVKDVAQVAATTLAIRQALTQMLPAPFFVALTPFAWVAFKAGRGGNAISTTIPIATQHQLLGVLLQNLGQAHLPEPTEALKLFSFILKSFPTLYKSVQQGVHTLMPLIPADHLPTIESAFLDSGDAVREVCAAAFSRFAHFATCRRALVLACVFARDSSPNVAKACTAIVQDPRYGFTLGEADWGDLTYLLRTYGRLRANAERIARTMKELFAACEDMAPQDHWITDIIAVDGLASVVALQLLSATYRGDVCAKVMDFLCSLTERLDVSESLMQSILSAGRTVLTDADLSMVKRMAPGLQGRLAKPPKEATPAHKEQYLATSTVWLTIISCRLGETELLEAIVEQQSRVLNNSNSAMVHRCVCDAMIEITKNDVIRRSPKLDEFVEKSIKQVIHSGSYIRKKAHAWGLAGVLQGLGLVSLRRYNIVGSLLKAGREKQTEKSGAMVMLEVLCDVMGTKFEPYALAMSQLLLESVADQDPKISECADDASRVMMSSLSGVGLRQLIPKLVESLTAEQAKKRVPPLNFIGYVAFCSPKQLAATLPEIMKHVIACLFDVNNAVSVAAYNALRRVAGVVSNPEIQEHVELVLKALRSPSTDTENALDALLYTRFVNVVDPASLALIVPVISRGLGAQMPHTRPKAAQIAASMVTLVHDPKTLTPYADELVRLLEEASQDPQSEARTTSAKALGALAAAIGGSLVDRITNWSFGVLNKLNSGAIEKAGAAQVFVELVHCCGDEVLQANFAAVEAGMTDEKPPVREGFLYIMVYTPSTLRTESFQKLLPIAFPWVLDGLSHFSDKVRDVALVAGDTIIALYGTRNLSLVLEPLLEGVVSEVTTLRHSSLQLASKLLLHLVAHIRKKMRVQAALETVAEEDRAALASVVELEGVGASTAAAADGAEGEESGLTMEAARDVEKRGVSILSSLEDMLGKENFVRMLSAIFCGRHEHGANVRNDANMAWQASVASIRAAVGKIFDALARLLIHFASSTNPDCEEVAAKTIEFTCRMNEMIERFVDCFCESYKESGRRVKLGALKCLSTVVQYADSQKLMSMGGQVVGCVLPGMQEKDEDVQEAARMVFGRVSKQVGPRLIESAVEAQLATSVRGVVEVVKVKPSVALALVFKYLNGLTVYSDRNLELLDAILDVEEAEAELGKYHEDTVRLLLAFLVQGLADAQEVMVKYVATMPSEYENLPVEYFQRALNVPATRRGALLAAEAYGLGTSVENVEGITAVLRAAITALGDDDEVIRADAVRMIPDLLVSLEERIIDDLDDDAREDVTASKRAAGRYQLQYLDVFKDTLAVTARACVTSDAPYFEVLGEGEVRLFDVLMSFYSRGLDYGTAQQKVDAVECIRDLMAFAPRALSASAANTVAGRCSKVLFTRNEGSVVLALVQLCLQILNYPASGKEKMVEGTMALAMFNAALCDSGPARVLALRIVVQLLQRSEKYADLILGTVVTKKAAVDSPLLKTIMCRFISVVVRYANFEKAFPHIVKLMDTVLPMWESADSPAQAAAAAVAVGALCKSASITEEKLGDIKERTLAVTSTKGVHALGGFALVYALVTAAPGRVDQTFLEVAAEHLSAAAAFGAADKLTTTWLLRAAAAVASTGCVPVSVLKPEAFMPLLRRVNASDELMMSTAQFFFDCVTGAYPTLYATLDPLPRETSSSWNSVGNFDADMDDEAEADAVY